MEEIILAHSELTNTIYALIGKEKIDITEQAIAEVKAIKALQEPKTGHWIKSLDSYGNNHFTCPFCGHDIATKSGTWEDNYCSNCGAKMVEPQESEEI